MKKVIIDGIEYVPVTPEEKPKRLSGWINSEQLQCKQDAAWISVEKEDGLDDTRMIEIREGEIVVSEEELIQAISEHVTASVLKYGSVDYRVICRELGFKKDGEK